MVLSMAPARCCQNPTKVKVHHPALLLSFKSRRFAVIISSLAITMVVPWGYFPPLNGMESCA